MSNVNVVDNEHLQRNGDPRISLYPFMDNPMLTIQFSAIYLVVTVLGVYLMKKRQPWDLKVPLFLYSVSVVLLSSWMFLKLGIHGWFTKYNWSCEPIDVSNDPDALEIVKVFWLFYITRLIEFVDTIFLVMKKNKSKLSIFHIFHRCVVPLIFWYAVKYGPGGYNTFAVMADLFVRSCLYLYYGISAIMPSIQRYISLKNGLTFLQMIQLFLVIVYTSRLLVCPPADCNVTEFPVMLYLSQAVVSLTISLYVFFSSSRKNAVKGIEKYKKK